MLLVPVVMSFDGMPVARQMETGAVLPAGVEGEGHTLAARWPLVESEGCIEVNIPWAGRGLSAGIVPALEAKAVRDAICGADTKHGMRPGDRHEPPAAGGDPAAETASREMSEEGRFVGRNGTATD